MVKKILIIFAIVVVVAAGWYLLSPLFITDTVDEEFPLADMTDAERELVADAVKDLDVNLPSLEEMKRMTKEEIDNLEAEMVKQSEQLPDKVMNEQIDIENEPVLLSSGEFRDADGFHKGSGTVGVYELEDGTRIVRFEDFKVTNGPDLRVILTKHSNPKVRSDVEEGYIELGKLKGNAGNQNYEISDDVDLSNYASVIIYCKPFHVVFSTATLN